MLPFRKAYALRGIAAALQHWSRSSQVQRGSSVDSIFATLSSLHTDRQTTTAPTLVLLLPSPSIARGAGMITTHHMSRCCRALNSMHGSFQGPRLESLTVTFCVRSRHAAPTSKVLGGDLVNNCCKVESIFEQFIMVHKSMCF